MGFPPPPQPPPKGYMASTLLINHIKCFVSSSGFFIRLMNDTQAGDDGEEKEDSEALVELCGHFEREKMTHEAGRGALERQGATVRT